MEHLLLQMAQLRIFMAQSYESQIIKLDVYTSSHNKIKMLSIISFI